MFQNPIEEGRQSCALYECQGAQFISQYLQTMQRHRCMSGQVGEVDKRGSSLTHPFAKTSPFVCSLVVWQANPACEKCEKGKERS
jgi:hypothetical protein